MADLHMADLSEAYLKLTNLSGADLREANPSGTQLANAHGDARTRVPAGMRPAHWPLEEPEAPAAGRG